MNNECNSNDSEYIEGDGKEMDFEEVVSSLVKNQDVNVEDVEKI